MENEVLHILKLETNGHCFICLKFKSGNGGGRAPHVELNNGEEGRDSSLYSLQKLTNHLEIDLKKLFKRSVNIPANLGLSGQTEVKASLCERCSKVLNGLSPLLQEIENIRLKINKGLEILSQGIEQGDTNPALVDSYNKRIKKNITSVLTSGFILGLRMQISKKCSKATKVPQSSRHLSIQEDSDDDDDDIEILSTGDNPSFTETVNGMPFLSPCRPTLPHELLIPQVNLNEEDDDIMVLGEFADQTTSSPVANKPVINRRSQPIKEPTIVPGSSRSLNPTVLSKPTQPHLQPTTFVKETMPIILPALNEVPPPPPISTNDLPFKCTLCKVKGYRTRKQLQRHRKSCRAKHATPQPSSFKPKPSPHKGKFKCRDPDCDKEFAMAVTAQVHYRAMHLGIRLSCNICQQGGFYDLSNLNKHKKIKHRNEWNARRSITSENVAGPTTSSNVYIVHEPSGAVHSLPAYESNDFSADLQDLIGC